MDYILQTNNLIKHYKNGKALNGLTMHVEKGGTFLTFRSYCAPAMCWS